MDKSEMSKYLGVLGEYVTCYLKQTIEQNSDHSDRLYISTRYEYGYFSVYLFNGDTGNTICKKWPLKEFIALCTNQIKREVVFNHTAIELIKKSKDKKYDKILYI